MNSHEEIAQGETYDLEFKLVPNEERIKYLKTVVAFANGKGGRILFGVANDRTVRGIDNDKVFAEKDAIVNSILGHMFSACSSGCRNREPRREISHRGRDSGRLAKSLLHQVRRRQGWSIHPCGSNHTAG